MALFAGGASIAVLTMYNAVNVFNRRIRTPNIANTHWAAFFACVACRAATQVCLPPLPAAAVAVAKAMRFAWSRVVLVLLALVARLRRRSLPRLFG